MGEYENEYKKKTGDEDLRWMMVMKREERERKN